MNRYFYEIKNEKTDKLEYVISFEEKKHVGQEVMEVKFPRKYIKSTITRVIDEEEFWQKVNPSADSN